MRIRSIAVQEAARAKGCSPMSILRAVQRGELKVVGKKGKQFLLSPDQVDAWAPKPVGRPRKEPAGKPA